MAFFIAFFAFIAFMTTVTFLADNCARHKCGAMEGAVERRSFAFATLGWAEGFGGVSVTRGRFLSCGVDGAAIGD